MEIRIGNDILIVSKIINLESYSQSDIKSLECILYYTPFDHDCFHRHYTPTEYTLNGCGNPIYNTYPHQHLVWHDCAAPFAFKHIQLEYTLDLENGTVTSTFDSSRLFHCGLYSYIIKIELSEDGYDADNMHQYTLDFGEIFGLSHCPTGSCGNIVVKTRPCYKVAYNGIEPEVIKYKCIFKDYNGTILSSKEYSEGDTIIKPSNPTRSGYTFIGWDPAVPEKMQNYDMTFVALYTEIPPTCQYVVFYGMRDSNPETLQFTVNEIESGTKRSSGTLPISIESVGNTRCKWWASEELDMTECKDQFGSENLEYLSVETIGKYTVWYDYSPTVSSTIFTVKFNK